MLGVVGDLLYRLIGGRQVAAEEALGVDNRAFGAQFVPDRKWILGPAWIGVVEIVDPIGDGGVIGHQGNFLLLSLDSFAPLKIRWVRLGTSVFGNFNRHFRAVGLRKPRLVLKSVRNSAVSDFVRITEFVEIEQFRSQRFAAGVSLTLVLVDVYFQLSGHFFAFPRRRMGDCVCGDYSNADGVCQRSNQAPSLILRSRAKRGVSKDGNKLMVRDGAIAPPHHEESCYFAGLGSIGVVPRRPRISSSTLAPASNCASPRGAATICSPIGRPDAVKPQGSDSAGQHASVMA